MTTYFYSYSPQEDRYMIDTKICDGFYNHDQVEADSWLEVKQKLGFGLTLLQQQMLKQKEAA